MIENTKTAVIDLGDFYPIENGRTITDLPVGERSLNLGLCCGRVHLPLYEKVEIVVPDHILAITPRFFVELLLPFARAYGMTHVITKIHLIGGVGLKSFNEAIDRLDHPLQPWRIE